MEKKGKWFSAQSLIVMIIIVLIMTYMGVDAFKTKPYIKQQVEDIKVQYVELSKYLDQKIPEIDSTLKDQGGKIINQTKDIDSLKKSISKKIGR
jgi:hypothetical protein